MKMTTIQPIKFGLCRYDQKVSDLC